MPMQATLDGSLMTSNPNQIQSCECRHYQGYPAPPLTIRDAQMSHYKLWCYVAGGFDYFSIKIDPSKYLDDLKELILNKLKNRLSGIDGDGLTIFKVLSRHSVLSPMLTFRPFRYDPFRLTSILTPLTEILCVTTLLTPLTN